MSYADISHFAQSWGLLLLCVSFALAVAYALWPSNRKTFDRARFAPLEEDHNERA
jgi:cytochrome c oxidase cbb3-type subunit IV